jgi:hypothetical protein
MELISKVYVNKLHLLVYYSKNIFRSSYYDADAEFVLIFLVFSNLSFLLYFFLLFHIPNHFLLFMIPRTNLVFFYDYDNSNSIWQQGNTHMYTCYTQSFYWFPTLEKSIIK